MKREIEDCELDVRYGQTPARIQDPNGVDLLQLRVNLTLDVEQRLLALEDFLRFVEAVRPVDGAR